MRLPQRQRGLGWLGLLFVFGIIALAATVTIRTLPLYLNQMKVNKAVKTVASDPGAAADGAALRSRLQRFWDIEDISGITPRDVQIRRNDRGRFLVYDYEVRTPLFYNISLVIRFRDEVPIANGG